jgi:hypothetical protein
MRECDRLASHFTQHSTDFDQPVGESNDAGRINKITTLFKSEVDSNRNGRKQ